MESQEPWSGAFDKKKKGEGRKLHHQGLPRVLSFLPLSSSQSSDISVFCFYSRRLSMTKTKPSTFSHIWSCFLTLYHPTIGPFSLTPNVRCTNNSPLSLLILSTLTALPPSLKPSIPHVQISTAVAPQAPSIHAIFSA